MIKYKKILSIILATTVSSTFFSTIVSNNHAEAKRINGRTKINNITYSSVNSNIKELDKKTEKIIQNIDTFINIDSGAYKVNKNELQNYINNNWNDIKNSFPEQKTKEDFINEINKNINNLNTELSTGQYKLTEDKAIIPLFQERSGSMTTYNYWWGRETRLHNRYQINLAVNVLRDVSKGSAFLGILSYACAPLAATLGAGSWYASHMADKISAWYSYGNCKLKVYWAGYFTTDRLW